MSVHLTWRRVTAGRYVATGYVAQLDAHGRWLVTRTDGTFVGFRRKLSEAQALAEKDNRERRAPARQSGAIDDGGGNAA